MTGVRSQRLVKAGILVVLVLAVMLITVGPQRILDIAQISTFILLGLSIALSALVILLLYVLAGGYLSRFIRFVAERSWYNMLPARLWTPEQDTWWRFLVKVSASTVVFSLSFLLYLTPLVIIFYLAGEPFSTQAGFLIAASFSALVIVRLARYAPNTMPEELTAGLTAFLLSFGMDSWCFSLVLPRAPRPLRMAVVAASLTAGDSLCYVRCLRVLRHGLPVPLRQGNPGRAGHIVAAIASLHCS